MNEILNKLWSKIIGDSNSMQRNMDSLHRKQTGSYYTSLDLAYEMVKELIGCIGNKEEIPYKTFLEPCVGTGNFVFAYLRVCFELNLSKEKYASILNNIYVCDINEKALNIYKENLQLFAQEVLNVDLSNEYFKTHIAKGLLFNVDSEDIKYISLSEAFGKEIADRKFDLIATNPPYKNLKAESSHYTTSELLEKDKQKYLKITELAKKNLPFSAIGTLNMYKLFVEEIIEKYTSPYSLCSLLIPASILSDKNCSNLRMEIINQNKIISIKMISEDSCYVDSSQALCSLLIKKGEKTNTVKVEGTFKNKKGNSYIANIEDITDASIGNSILILAKEEYEIRKKMLLFPKIKDIPYIHNLRGELDITLNKDSIVQKETEYKFYRGRNIGFYKNIELAEKEYATKEFVEKTSKSSFIKAPRLVCQQIANMSKKKRIAFTLVEKNSVLGNSCNFISVDGDKIDLYFLLGVLNSDLMERYFNMTSSNNHVNNYEIANFPIPIDCDNQATISNLVKKYLSEQNQETLTAIENEVLIAYGIKERGKKIDNIYDIFGNKSNLKVRFFNDMKCIFPDIKMDDIEKLLCKTMTIDGLFGAKELKEKNKFLYQVSSNIILKYQKISQGEVLNHTTFKLSDLDLEMIKSIPQGGNWKDIPQATINKSKRLSRITQTGGRTTLYGRIDYFKPSYTITTYFNRPGNGTYVHPIHERVITVREAARFQCFPDEYYFYGTKANMLKQVGNAVPTLLAYCIGKSIVEKVGCRVSVDLFSGAGGMTYGFERAGIHPVVANDIIENTCITLKTNIPSINVICGDITKEEIKDEVIKCGVLANADIVCGGPPCQGFSMAGFRNENDPRNLLFRPFIEIVSKIAPKVVVFENVEGLLSYQGGKTYNEVLALFSALGYYAEGRKLFANFYGVPQRRKRVIILCVRKDIGVMPSELYPEFITPNLDAQITAYQTIFDLEGVECSEKAKYSSSYRSPLIEALKGKISLDEYLKTVFDDRGAIDFSEDIEDDTDEEGTEEGEVICKQLTLF